MNNAKTQEDPIYKRRRTGLDMYLNATLDEVRRLIPDLDDVRIKGVIENCLEEVGDFLEGAPRRGNLRESDLKILTGKYRLIKNNYQRKIKQK